MFILISCYTFYCSHWVTYVTGSLHFGTFDVTEAQVTVIGIFLLTALFGEQFWAFTWFFGYPLRFIIYSSLLASVMLMWLSYMELGTTQGAGMNGATVANTSIISPVQPIGALLWFALQIAYRTQLYQMYVKYLITKINY